jgi:hypothetical protein
MKKIIKVTLFFIIVITSLILNCGKPNESIGKFKIVSTCANPGYTQSVWIGKINNKPYAFVASGQAGMVIYNIDNPESTYIVAQWFDTTYIAWGITTLSNYAYLVGGKNLTEKIDVSNLDSLRLVSYFPLQISGYAYDISMIDTNYSCVAANERCFLINLLTSDYGYITFPNSVRGVFFADSLAYLACEQLGLYIVKPKFSPYLSISILGSCDTPSNARSLFVSDNTCYIADGRNGIVLIDVTNPRDSKVISHLSLSGYACRIYVKDTLAYVACENAGVAIVNVKDKNNPTLVETVKTSYAKGIFAPEGSYIYVADRDDGLVVIKQEEQ